MTGNYGGQQGGQRVTLFNVIATPVLICILASILLITNLVSLIGVLVNGGEIVYEEAAVTSYTTGAYDDQFKKVAGKNAKDSGIAIMFFYNEDINAWEHTTVIGNNVSSEIKNTFSGESSAMYKYLNDKVAAGSQDKAFVTAISGMMTELAKVIDEYDLTSPFVKNTDLSKMPKSCVVLMPKEKANEKAQPVVSEDGAVILSVEQGEELSKAMVAFTEATGVPVLMTIDTSVRAFGRTIPTTDIFMVVLLLAVVALCVFNIVKKTRDYNRIKNDFAGQDPLQPEGGIKVNARSPYYDEDEDEVAVDDFEVVDEGDEEGDEESEETEEADESEEESDGADESEEEKSEDSEDSEEEDLKKRSLSVETDDEEEDDGEADENLAFEDEEYDEDNGIIDSGDESYDDDEITDGEE